MNGVDLIVEGYTLEEVPIGGLSFSKELIEARFSSSTKLAVVAKKRTRIGMLIEDDVYTTLGVVVGISCRVGMTPVAKIYRKQLGIPNYRGMYYRGGRNTGRTQTMSATDFAHIEALWARHMEDIWNRESIYRSSMTSTSSIREFYYRRSGIDSRESNRRPIQTHNLCQEIYLPGYDPHPYWEDPVKVSKTPPSVLRQTKFNPVEHRTITGISGINKVDMQIVHVDYKAAYSEFYDGFGEIFRRAVNELPEHKRNTFGRHSRGVFFQKLR